MTRVDILLWLSTLNFSAPLFRSSTFDDPTRIDQSTTPFQLPMTFIVRLRSRSSLSSVVLFLTAPSQPWTGWRRGVRRRLVATISNTAVDGAKEKVINRMFMSTKSSAYQFSLRPLRGSLPRRFPRSLPISCPCHSPRRGLASRHRPLEGDSQRPPHPDADELVVYPCVRGGVNGAPSPLPCPSRPRTPAGHRGAVCRPARSGLLVHHPWPRCSCALDRVYG